MAAFKILAYPKLGMRLEIGGIYTHAELESRCGRNHKARRKLLHEKLKDRTLFKPMSLSSALKPVKKTVTKKKVEQPHWVKAPVLRPDPDKKDEVGRKRLIADSIAGGLLQDAEQGRSRITDASVLLVLRVWGFYLNALRTNVTPDGQQGVFSDTLGLTRSRDHKTNVSLLSRTYPNVTRLLMQWFHNHAGLDADFPVTSISVNSKYAAKRHRDKNNEGPSVIRAFGKFRGGNLNYWPGDTSRGPVDKLVPADSVALNVRKATQLFDGRRAHEVTPFDGPERFSLVFFTLGKYWKAPQGARTKAEELGFCFPTPESVKRASALVEAR